MSGRGLGRQGGFSLAETVIAVAVAGVCAGAMASAWPAVSAGVAMEAEADAREAALAARDFLESRVAQAVPGTVRMAKAPDGALIVGFLVSRGSARARAAGDPSSALPPCPADDPGLANPGDNDALLPTADTCLKTSGAAPALSAGDLLLAIPEGAGADWAHGNARPIVSALTGPSETRIEIPATAGLSPGGMRLGFAEPLAVSIRCPAAPGRIEEFRHAPEAAQRVAFSGAAARTLDLGASCDLKAARSGVYGAVAAVSGGTAFTVPVSGRARDE